MLVRRQAGQRGRTRIGWLDSHHSFAFGGYRDHQHQGFGPLRVINDDIIQGGSGFGTHPHADMEIISYPVDGALAHRDSLGTERTIAPGEIQVMSAGTGVTHSEYNHSPDQAARFLQIWLLPDRRGHAPRYDQRRFPIREQADRLHLLVSPDGSDGSLPVHQDAWIYAARISAGSSLPLPLSAERAAWIQVVLGAGTVQGLDLQEGDGLAISQEGGLAFTAASESEILVFDLPVGES